MRRVLPVAILLGLLAASPAAVAQRGGAGHAGGHAGGFAGGFHGGFSAPRSFGGFSGFAQRGFSAAPRMAPRMTLPAPRYGAVPRYGSAFRPVYNAGRGGWNHGGRYPHRPPYRGYSGYGAYAYPYYSINSWELLPWDLGYPDFTGYGDDSETDQAPEQAEPQPQYPAPPDESYGQGYAPPYPTAPAPAASPAPVQSQPQLTLIFQDGHTETIRNYAVTSSAVIVMDQAASGREPQIPLSALNLPATERAARQAGLDFAPPAS